MDINFNGRIARIVKELQTRICIDDADVEILEGLLKDELKEYYDLIDNYYEEEYYNAVSSARNIAYDNGHSDGYAEGYDFCYAECHSENNY